MLATKPKHVIWITTDHLRWDNIAAHGQSLAYTPNIDRLVNHGVSFSNCFTQSPMCMPSRCSFMTGTYPHQTGVIRNGQELAVDHPLAVARPFKAAGYTPGQIGKLHFQCHEDNDLRMRERADYGFDYFICDEEPGCYDGPYLRWLATERPDLVDTFRTNRPMNPQRMNETKTPTILDAPWQYSFSGWVSEQICRYLGAWGGRRALGENHFIHMGIYAPHPPLNPTRDMYEAVADLEDLGPVQQDGEAADKTGPLRWMLENASLNQEEILAYRRHFAAMVSGIDFAVGHLINTLKELGIYDDTLICFGSDHGDFCGDHGLVLKNHAWYDGVARVPLICHWPNGLKHHGTIDGLVEMVDVLPTLLGLSQGHIPDAMSGCDWSSPLIHGDFDAINREDIFATFENGHLMIRSHDYKYLRYHEVGQAPSEVLYDLKNDPNEFVNCAFDESYTNTLNQFRQRALTRLIEASQPTTPLICHF